MIRWISVLALSAALLQGQSFGPATPLPVERKSAAKGDNKGPRCQARTRDGKQCSRKAAPGSQFCWQHSGRKKPS